MPLIIDKLLQKKDVDAVITLGAVIKGQTKHDESISNVTAKALVDLSIKYQKPVTLGITGPKRSDRQAHQRIRPVSEDSCRVCKEIVRRIGEN